MVHKGRMTLQVMAQDLKNSLGALVGRSCKPGAPVDMGVEYNLSRRPSETPLAKVGEEDIVQEAAIGL